MIEPDAGTPAAGTPAAGMPTTGTPDTSMPDTGTPDTGTPDTSMPDAGLPAADGTVQLLADAERPAVWTLLIDGILQSEVDLKEPRHLEIEYVRRLGHLIDLAAPAGMPLRALHLGGGALTLARYVEATRPGSRQLAVESNVTVAALVNRRLPVTRPGRGGPAKRGPAKRGPAGRGPGLARSVS